MSIKRKSAPGSAPDMESSPNAAKRAKTGISTNAFVPKREKPTVNQTYGQMSAIPGLDDAGESDEGDDDEDDEDGTKAALRYLRNVRSEAQGIPKLLVAPKNTDGTGEIDSDEGIEDPRGYYEDGAYVAAPVLGPVKPPSGWRSQGDHDDDIVEADFLSPEEAYTQRLLKLMREERDAVRIYRASHQAKSEDLGYTGNWKSFTKMVHSFAPTHSRVTALSQDTILRMLNNACHDLKRRRNLTRKFSQWIWALLCALGDVYTLDSDAVSIVRELGKKAVWVGIGYIGAEEADATAAYDQDDMDSHDGSEELEAQQDDKVVVDITPEVPIQANSMIAQGRRRNTSSPEPPSRKSHSLPKQSLSSTVEDETSTDAQMVKARLRLLSKLSEPSSLEEKSKISEATPSRVSYPDDNTRATLDMIITVAGELYGQRDLLEFRSVWIGLWG